MGGMGKETHKASEAAALHSTVSPSTVSPSTVSPSTVSPSTVMQILQPPGWPRPKGYANGVLAEGRLLFVAGQIGWDAEQRIVAGGLAGQTERALRNVVAVLREGGAGPEHIARMTWYVTDKRTYHAAQAEVGQAYRAVIGAHYPAMTLVEVAGLLEPGAVVEIEATAVVPYPED